jgi:hypothetical protein
LSDGTGILQHAVYGVPNYHEGYTTDDNARALILATLLEQAGPESYARARDLAARYLGFLNYAFDPTTGRFRNFLSYDRRWCEAVSPEDPHGRALWALGVVSASSAHAELRGTANQLIGFALRACLEFTSPRAWAFALIGAEKYLQAFPGDRLAQEVREVLLGRLLDLYHQNSCDQWPWFEDIVSYANAVLPHALLVTGSSMRRDEVVEVGQRTLRWLADLQRPEKDFVPIGTQGFYVRGKERARFDQQPIEAQAMVSACLAAHSITGERRWQVEAKRAFKWFLGQNDLRLALYNPATGGCRDGLHPNRANQNEGAESTVSFLLSLVEMRLAENALTLSRDASRTAPGVDAGQPPTHRARRPSAAPARRA